MQEFLDYLKSEKHKAKNTLIAYTSDLRNYANFLANRGIDSIDESTDSDAVSYYFDLKNQGKSKSTINRSVAALRAYFDYKIMRHERETNPFARMKTEKGGSRKIRFLTIEQVESLIEATDNSPKGIRDRALFEFMYGTGVRVSELIRLRFGDIDMKMDFVTLRDANDENRIVPMGRYAKSALYEYFLDAYATFKGSYPKDDDIAFINTNGEPLSRQGIWMILRDYGERLNLGIKMTPQILRDSCAVHILQNGGDLKTIQELMGFEDMSIPMKYMSVVEVHVKEVFNRTHPRA